MSNFISAILNPKFLVEFLQGKPWYESATVWGCIIWMAVGAGLDQACVSVVGDLPVLGEGICNAWDSVRDKVGPVLMTLGLYRKIGSSGS